jgi:predicted deacylase
LHTDQQSLEQEVAAILDLLRARGIIGKEINA